MGSISALDEKTGRKFYLDDPDDLRPGEKLIFLLNLHGGGSVGAWQKLYFPAQDFKEKYRLVIATPSAATKEPSRRWVGEADDEHLQNIVEYVLGKYGKENIAAFWLVGHSQGGMTSNRLLRTPYFADRVDGWLSLSGGRIGPATRSATAGRPGGWPGAPQGGAPAITPPPPELHQCDMSFIFAIGEHEIAELPETSPWAEKYGAGTRVLLDEVVDDQPGQVYDSTVPPESQTKAWGRQPRPGTARVYVFPNARDGRVIADVLRLDKGHTEGLEHNVMDRILGLIASAPGGKAQRLA